MFESWLGLGHLCDCHDEVYVTSLQIKAMPGTRDNIPDTKVLKKANIQSIHTLLKLAQLRWTGHVTRTSDERLPKKVFYGEFQEGKRSQGGH